MYKINVKYPKWKNRKSKQSFKSKMGVNIVDGKLEILKIKNPIKMKYSRPIRGEILSATVSKDNDRYYVTLNCKKVPVESLPKTDKKIDVDLGIKDSITTSEGFKSGKIELKKLDSRIDLYNKQLSNKKLGSNRWRNVRAKLNNVYYKKKIL